MVGVGRLIKKIAADLVADIPGVKAACPFFHLLLGYLFIVIYKACQYTRFVNAGFPELKRQTVVLADFFGQFFEVRDGNAVSVMRIYTEARHTSDCLGIRQGFQPFGDFFKFHGGILHYSIQQKKVLLFYSSFCIIAETSFKKREGGDAMAIRYYRV